MPGVAGTNSNRQWRSRWGVLVVNVAMIVSIGLLTLLIFGDVSWITVVRVLTILLVYSLCLGPLFGLVLPPLTSRVERFRFPLDWLCYAGSLIVLTATSSGIASFILILAEMVPSRLSWNELFFINRLVLVITVVFGLLSYAYTRTRSRLMARNRELQRELDHESHEARSRERELEQARAIQVNLLPRQLPAVPGFELAGEWRPAGTVGGDYYDALRLDGRVLAVCIADVVGKGISAALLMSNVQAAVRAFATPSTSPAALCGKVNEVLCGHVADGKFVTFFYGLLDAERRRFSYTRAGHNPPLLVRNDGSVERLEIGGAIVGVFRNERYQEEEIQIAPGDRLVLFTDGISEAANQEGTEFGEPHLASLVVENRALGAAELKDRILDALTRFSGERLADDATLLVLAAL